MTTFCRMVASAQSEAALSNRYVAEHLRIPRQLYERKLCGVVHAATKSIRAVSEAGAYAMDALADGRIDVVEGRRLEERIGDGRQALADLEASVNAARVA